MKNLKRVLALVIALVFVMGTVAFADTTDTTTEPAAYAKAQDLLGQLNIMVGDENGNFNADKTITKGEAARIIYSLLVEMGGTLPGTDTVFSDVTSLYWGSGYINALNGASINGANVINGTGDGTFAPTKLLSYDEINTMLTIAIGYQPYAKRNGGFPFGYRTAASKAKLYDNTFGTVTYGGSKGITRGEVAILVANALIANPMVPTGYSDDGTSYDFDDKTIFAKSNCGLTMVSGVARTDGSNFSVKDVKGLKAGDSKIKDAIGLNVIAFYNSGKTIEALVINGERESLTTGTDNAKFKFYKDGDNEYAKVSVNNGTTKYTVAEGAKTTINGTEVAIENLKATADALKALNSTFKVALYGEGTTVNEIAIEIYSAGKVENLYTSTNNARVNVEGKSSLFTIKSGNDTFTKADGEAGTVKDMAKDTFVKVTPIVNTEKAVDEYFHNIVVAETKLEDVYASYRSSDDKFTIDGTAYASNKNFLNPADVTVGKVGTFTLDVNNKIVAYAASTEATNEYLGYITYAGLLQSGRNSGKVTFDIVIDGKTLSYTTTDKFDDSDDVTTVADKLVEALDLETKDLTTAEGAAVAVKQIASVKLDKNDNVTDIAFVANGTPANLTYNKSLNKLSADGKTIYLSSSSKVYTIDTKGKIVEKELSYLTDKTEYTGVVEIKNFKDKVIGIMITGEAAVNTLNTGMVTTASGSSFIDGEEYTTVSIRVHGEEEPVQLKTKKSGVLSGMVVGDYISYKVDGDGNVIDADVLARYNDGISYDADGKEYQYNIAIVGDKLQGSDNKLTKSGYATIVSKEGVKVGYMTGRIRTGSSKTNVETNTETFDVSDNLKVYVYDVTAGSILSGATAGSDLVPSEIIYENDKVVEASYSAMYVNVDDKGEVTEIVIYTALKDNVK